MKDFSIIIPAHNSEKTLLQCVESVMKKAQDICEVIIVENSSNDNTVDLCKQLEKQYDNIIFLQCETGPSQARNLGLEKASGKYVIFLDSDDFMIGDLRKVEKLVIDENELYFVKHETINDKNEIKESYYNIKASAMQNITGKQAYFILYNQNFIATGPCVFLYKREYLMKNSFKFDEKIFLGEDACFVTQCVWNAKSVTMLDETLLCFRIAQENTLSSSFNEKSCKNIYLSWCFGFNYCQNFSSEDKNIFLCPYINSALWFMQQLHGFNNKQKKVCKKELDFLTKFLRMGYKARHKMIGYMCSIFGVVTTAKLLKVIIK